MKDDRPLHMRPRLDCIGWINLVRHEVRKASIECRSPVVFFRRPL